jgi:hypothetical protein
MAPGYSGTPLAKKLSLKDEMRVWASGMPASVREEIDIAGFDLRWLPRPVAGLDVAHVFVDRARELARLLERLRKTIARNGMVWVSWPKKASGVKTDITEDTVREVALPLGFVDVKVCSVDEVWSGLKLVIRKKLRG